jgi:Leucine-rich repeat (LRR) protein
MHLSSQALIKASPACLWRNARRLATLRAAFAKEPNTTDGGEERAINKAAVELLEASATNLVSLTIDDLGRRLQDSPWGRLTSLTRLQLNNSGSFSLPSGLGTLTGLQHLSINNFTQITNLAYLDERVNMRIPWVQQLTNLTSLSVTRTNRFFNIGGHLPTSLQELDLDVNPVFEALPDSVSQVTGLRSVTLSGLIANLPEGLGSLPQLSRLCFNKCDSLRWLPDKLLQSTSIHSVSIICNTTHR